MAARVPNDVSLNSYESSHVFQYGLYSAFVGCFVYCFFGSSKDITIGPTAIMALMTAEHVHSGPDGPAFAILLAFLSGVIIFVLGALQLGKLCL